MRFHGFSSPASRMRTVVSVPDSRVVISHARTMPSPSTETCSGVRTLSISSPITVSVLIFTPILTVKSIS